MANDLKRSAAEAQLSAFPAPAGEAGWAREVRAKARTRFLEAGAPVRRDEYWRYTDPSRLTAPLETAREGDAEPLSDVFGRTGQKALFVNGRFRGDLSNSLGGSGAAVQMLSDALSQDITIARKLFGVLEEAGHEKVDRPLAALNTSSSTDGLLIQCDGDPEPIHIDYQQVGEGASLVHHLIRVESGASLTLLESGVATNTVMEVDVADGGEFHHVRLQTTAVAPVATHVFARLGAESAFKTFTLTADGSLTRNEVVMDLTGDEGSGHIAGAVLAGGQSHVDNTVFVTHSAEDCESRQVFKNVLGGQGKAIFQGKIFVREGAQKTDGYQISQAVLLNDGAEFSAKPELEIYADDVACSHGSTTGALDPTAMFYLQSRGVPKAEAEAMLIAAFADEAIEEIADEELADIVRGEVQAWMARRE
ncbi:MAG: Fe-S cluster assembly protein SufD [Pseudomonadota bacterium]